MYVIMYICMYACTYVCMYYVNVYVYLYRVCDMARALAGITLCCLALFMLYAWIELGTEPFITG